MAAGVTIIDPYGTNCLVGPNQAIRIQAITGGQGVFVWTYAVNGGAATQFDGTRATAVFTTPSTVANADAAGEKGCDKIVITGLDQSTGQSASVTFILVAQKPRVNDTGKTVTNDASVRDASVTPDWQTMALGPSQLTVPTSDALEDEDDVLPDTDFGCGCGCT
jgi:hypothetical protein